MPVPAGLVATTTVTVSLVIVADDVPNSTLAVAIVPMFAPLIVTGVPPPGGPPVGLMPVSVVGDLQARQRCSTCRPSWWCHGHVFRARGLAGRPP